MKNNAAVRVANFSSDFHVSWSTTCYWFSIEANDKSHTMPCEVQHQLMLH